MNLDGVALRRRVGAEDMVGDLDLEFLGRLAVVVDFLGERWGRSGEARWAARGKTAWRAVVDREAWRVVMGGGEGALQGAAVYIRQGTEARQL